LPFDITEADVSSQDDSMASIVTFIIFTLWKRSRKLQKFC